MKFEWIKCEDRLPETPKSPLDTKNYVTACKSWSAYVYQTMGYADGWNCSLMLDGTICRDYEINGIVAWAEIPEFDGN